MIKLLTLEPGDGGAFVEVDGQVRHVRPPFDRVGSPSSMGTVIRALDEFTETVDREFDSWAAMAAWIRERRNALARGRPRRDPRVLDALVSHAPAYVVERWLDQVRDELIAAGEIEQARRALERIADHAASPDLRERAMDAISDLSAG